MARPRFLAYIMRERGLILLILKLTLLPLALLLLGIVERLHGPRIAGWLTGFPIVVGPMLLFISVEQGGNFGSATALGAYFGLVPWLAFSVTYAWAARTHSWMLSLFYAFAAWGLVAAAVVAVQDATRWLELLPFAAFIGAVLYFPRGAASDEEREHIWWGLPARMAAGMALTLLITRFAAQMGSHWSGIFSTFPVIGSIVAVSNHLQYGRHAVQEAVAGMSMGLAAVESFCFAAYVLLPRMEIGMALGLSLVISSAAHALTWLLFKHRPARRAIS